MPSRNDDATGAADRARSRLAFEAGTARESVDAEAFRSLVRRLLAVTVVALVLALLAVAPGVDRTLPRTSLTILSLAVALGTLMAVRLLVATAGDAEDVVRTALAGPADLRVTAGVVTKHLVVLVAVLVAHAGLAGVFVPLLAPSDTVWAYDLAFLALAAVPTAFVAYYCYGAIDASATHLARRALGDDRVSVTDQPTAVDDEADG